MRPRAVVLVDASRTHEDQRRPPPRPGIGPLVDARRLTGIEKIHAVVGGFHLTGGWFDPIIHQTIAALVEIGPDYLVPGHCTGFAAMHQIANALSPNATREVFYNLGEVEFAKGKVEDAVAAYTRAAQMDPRWGKPVFALGKVALNKGDTKGAIDAFNKVVEIDPSSPEAA